MQSQTDNQSWFHWPCPVNFDPKHQKKKSLSERRRKHHLNQILTFLLCEHSPKATLMDSLVQLAEAGAEISPLPCTRQ